MPHDRCRIGFGALKKFEGKGKRRSALVSRRLFSKLLGLGLFGGLVKKERGLALEGQISPTAMPGPPPPASQCPSDKYIDGSGNPWQQHMPPPPADLLPVSAGVTSSAKSPQLLTYKGFTRTRAGKASHSLVRRLHRITGHDHCLEPGDFRDMEAGGITVPEPRGSHRRAFLVGT